MNTLSIAKRSGVWSVTLNGHFYGDYFRQDWAKQAALERARQLRSAGKCARVEIADEQGNVTTITGPESVSGKQRSR